MDFGKLLTVAQKNSSTKQNVSYYPTKFTPPKKEAKQQKSLSENIKKFLARKEEEERQKLLEEKRKKENLLSMRDQKAQNKINKHLKVCKAANKSVLADAVNHKDTAITLAGPSQPDEDDYGYVSQEASAFYDKLMSKYQSLPPEKPLFSESGKKIVKDIASTKDRVKQALKQQELEASLPHRRKRKSDACRDESQDNSNDRDNHSSNSNNEEDKPKPKKRPLPPPIDFMSLLKIAEQKQHEPVVIEPKVKPKEEVERPMTKKQKAEYLKEKEYWDRREREKNGDKSSVDKDKSSVKSSTSAGKSSKPNGIKVSDKDKDRIVEKEKIDKIPVKSAPIPKKIVEKKPSEKPSGSKPNIDPEEEELKRKLAAKRREIENMQKSLEEEERLFRMKKTKKVDESNSSNGLKSNGVNNHRTNGNNLKTSNGSSSSSSDGRKLNGKLKPEKRPDGKTGKFPPDVRPRVSGDVKPRQFPPADVKPRQFPPPDVKPRQFPPPDVRPRQFPPSDVRKNGSKPQINKRRIYDDDDEEEYDSELDDFIDDGPQNESEDYSKYISEIFGYDKSKYANVDDDDDNMESNYAQVLKEEFVSTKIGIMEDLEDIRQENLEKKRKAMMMKKQRRK